MASRWRAAGRMLPQGWACSLGVLPRGWACSLGLGLLPGAGCAPSGLGVLPGSGCAPSGLSVLPQGWVCSLGLGVLPWGWACSAPPSHLVTTWAQTERMGAVSPGGSVVALAACVGPHHPSGLVPPWVFLLPSTVSRVTDAAVQVRPALKSPLKVKASLPPQLPVFTQSARSLMCLPSLQIDMLAFLLLSE